MQTVRKTTGKLDISPDITGDFDFEDDFRMAVLSPIEVLRAGERTISARNAAAGKRLPESNRRKRKIGRASGFKLPNTGDLETRDDKDAICVFSYSEMRSVISRQRMVGDGRRTQRTISALELWQLERVLSHSKPSPDHNGAQRISMPSPRDAGPDPLVAVIQSYFG